MKTLEEVKAILDRPLPPEAVTPHPTKPYLSSIKAIYIVERFNEAFGLGGWTIKNEVIEAGEKMIVVKANFFVRNNSFGIEVLDIFGGNDNPDRGDAYKGACTDALTKIGSYLGVGMDVYKGKQTGKKPNPAASQELAPKPQTYAPRGLPKPYMVRSRAATPDAPNGAPFSN